MYNFFESVIGVIILTGIVLYLNLKLLNIRHQFANNTIYILATILAGIYVITQEFKIHNFGGNNVYDINEVYFSIVGLMFGFFTVFRVKPKINPVN